MPRTRATLSDLLADDVKDYFRREGVNEYDHVENGDASGKWRRRRDEKCFPGPISVESGGITQAQPQHTEQAHQAHYSQRHYRHPSDTQRKQMMTPNDAEFLKRYAQEKERASRTVYKSEGVNISAPRDCPFTAVDNGAFSNINGNSGINNASNRSNNGSSNNRMNKINRNTQNHRPYQKLAASSRPPAVTGSHRPQLPSIDHDDWEEDDRLERKEKRKERRRKRSLSNRSVGSGASSSVVSHYRQMSNFSYGSLYNRHESMGSGSFVRVPPIQSSPGTLCYSSSSSHIPKESAMISGDSNGHNKGHVRPLSYLSASSESEPKSEPYSSVTPYEPSPLSSGTFKTFKSHESTSASLYGGSILESSGSEVRRSAYRREYNDSEREYDGSEGSTSSSEDISESSSDSEYETVSEKHQLLPKYKRNYSMRQSKRRISPLRLDDALKAVWDKVWSGFVVLELYISNMPSLVGSLALAWSTLGVDWFKWYEETFDTCHPTDYHNKLCTYPEFPGCFVCDTTQIGYQFTLHFHYLCSTISVIMAVSLIGKILIAFPVVRDELANPTTAAPLGLLCMALEKTFGGNFGIVGMTFVFGAAAVQTIVAIWFIFISIVYKTLPEPSWFANTTGLGLAAAKIYLYWSMGGYCLSALSVVLFMMFYFVALYRVHANYKISAPVCWVQLSGPAVVLYGASIFGQPGSDEAEIELASSQENIQRFTSIHRHVFMPFMHFFFACCMISMVSALYCLKVRFKRFREKEFSPAHVAFCAPILSHSNALQVYRSAVKRFTTLSHDHMYKIFLYQYWTLCLTTGTVLIFIMTWRFIEHLPKWCRIDTDDDEIPPEPEETMLTKLLEKGDAKDEITQDYVSAAVLQANESGALVRVFRDGKMKYMRSRRMPSMGFDPIMSTSQLLNERDRLLQHVKYEASLRDRERGTNSFDDTLSSFYDRSSSRDTSSSSMSSRRNRRNFMSFDASAMMRGDHD